MKQRVCTKRSKSARAMQVCAALVLILLVVVVGRLWVWDGVSASFPSIGSFWGAALVRSQAITSDTVIPLSGKSQITTARLSGTAKLNSNNGLVRVVLVDTQGNEYLVYEANAALNNIATNLSLNSVCEETCAFGPVTPASYKVQITEGSLAITSFAISKPKIYSAGAQSSALFTAQKTKLNAIQTMIAKKNLTWTAGETQVSKLTYAEKKKLFTHPDGTPVSDLPNLRGFEYYKGGIFTADRGASPVSPSPGPSSAAWSTLPASWDWRNVLGQNWNTPVKNQGSAGNCWAFGPVAAMESEINLWYGQNLNLDLSEQQLPDCTLDGQEIPLNEYYSIDEPTSIADETCDPYAQREIGRNCNSAHLCSDWASRLWSSPFVTSYNGAYQSPAWTFLKDSDDLKRIILTKGPIAGGVNFLGHAMELEGYGGSDDWKVLQSCTSNRLCADTGCIEQTCVRNGEERRFCETYDDSDVSFVVTLTCVSNRWQISSQACGTDQMCFRATAGEPQCVSKDSVTIPVGYQECHIFTGGVGLYQSRREYAPGNGDPFWIFKNSWGSDFGDNGYVSIKDTIADMGGMFNFNTPFTPPADPSRWPTGFANSPSPWFYAQICDHPNRDPNYTVHMGFQNGEQNTQSLACPAGRVCQAAEESGFVRCVPLNVRGPWDIDDNSSMDTATDGKIIFRYLFDPNGPWEISDILGPKARRNTVDAVRSYLHCLGSKGFLDIDGNGHLDALTDGIILNRHLSGYYGQQLTDGAIGSGATRTTAEEIVDFIDSLSETAGQCV